MTTAHDDARRAAAIDPEHTTVHEVLQRFPATIEVFNRFGIHTCCGGSASLRAAAVRDGADPAALLEALRQAVEAGSE